MVIRSPICTLRPVTKACGSDPLGPEAMIGWKGNSDDPARYSWMLNSAAISRPLSPGNLAFRKARGERARDRRRVKHPTVPGPIVRIALPTYHFLWPQWVAATCPFEPASSADVR